MIPGRRAELSYTPAWAQLEEFPGTFFLHFLKILNLDDSYSNLTKKNVNTRFQRLGTEQGTGREKMRLSGAFRKGNS